MSTLDDAFAKLAATSSNKHYDAINDFKEPINGETDEDETGIQAIVQVFTDNMAKSEQLRAEVLSEVAEGKQNWKELFLLQTKIVAILTNSSEYYDEIRLYASSGKRRKVAVRKIK